MSKHQNISKAPLALAVAVALIVTGCSSSKSGTSASGTTTSSSTTSGSAASGSAGSSSSNPAVASAEALVQRYEATQPNITVAPLNSKPPAGKRVALIQCPFPSCAVVGGGVTEAATKIGWTTKVYMTPLTVEGSIATWNQVLQTPPDFIIYFAGLPNSVLAGPLAKAAALKIPVVALSSTEHTSNEMLATIAGSATTQLSGKLMGSSIIADAKGPAKAVFVWDPTTALAFGPLKQTFTQAVTAAGGQVDVLNVNAADTGKGIPAQVVSYLQAHPDVKYAAFAPAVYLTGVPQAIKSAGLSSIKLTSFSPSTADLPLIKSGEEWNGVAGEVALSGYRAIDTLARIQEGMSYDKDPAGVQQILTKDNVTDSVEPAINGNAKAAYATAWHVS